MGMELFETAVGYRGQGARGGVATCTCWLVGKRVKGCGAACGEGERDENAPDARRKVFVGAVARAA